MEAVNTNFKVIGLTRLGIKPKFTAPEADALTTRPSELLKHCKIFCTGCMFSKYSFSVNAQIQKQEMVSNVNGSYIVTS